jgi:hypothetical protein
MNLRRSVVVLSALFSLIAGASRSSAQATTGSVVGRVVDSTGRQPIPGATVQIVGRGVPPGTTEASASSALHRARSASA